MSSDAQALPMHKGTSSKQKQCQYCKKQWNLKGFASHERACSKKTAREERDAEFEHAMARQRHNQEYTQKVYRESSQSNTSINVIFSPDHHQNSTHSDSFTNIESNQYEFADTDLNEDDPQSSEYNVDDICVEYHPHSGKKSEVYSFDSFQQELEEDIPIPKEKPYHPFRTRGDFTFADLAHNAALNNDQINKFIDLLHAVASGAAKFTLKNHQDLKNVWDKASVLQTNWTKKDITVQYKKDDTRSYEVWHCPLWDWTLDLLEDPYLQPHFVWDAQRLSKFNGNRWIRFYDEPWTANRWWNIQSNLPPNGKPLCYILYADKTRLSFFGTAKAYLVMARIANLPVGIRNGRGIGGGRIVGWLPIISEDANEAKKTGWINFKRVVWHDSFWVLLETLATYSKHGFAYQFLETLFLLFPLIYILAADYEEQCMMALIRGIGSNFPCPICLVPADQLANMLQDYPIRNASTAQALVQEAKLLSQAEGEAKLKSQGLRNVENVFWKMENSDPHAALSFDRLHAYHSGLFANHLLEEIKMHANILGRDAIAIINTQMAALPPWRNFSHFTAALSVPFTDGGKWEDMSKGLLFACQNILTEQKSPGGYLLLQCLRSYLIIDMYFSLEVHTEDTIAAGENELLQYSKLIQLYADRTDSTKNWNFPKNHTHKHGFADIRAKGVTRNYNTKIFEQMHGPLKEAYLFRSNFKAVAEQITNVDHISLIADIIRQDIEAWDLYYNPPKEDSSDSTILEYQRIQLGAQQKPVSLAVLQQNHQKDLAFSNFRHLLSNFLNDFFPMYGIPIPNGKIIQLSADHMIQEYRFIKVSYESYEDWRLKTDYLRCNPNFHGRECYDYILIHGEDKDFFAQLILIFTIQVNSEKSYPLAFIQPLDRPTGVQRRKDKHLGLYRIGAQPRQKPEFISVHAIVRGAYIVPDFAKDGDFYVVDIIDGDMFLRLSDKHTSEEEDEDEEDEDEDEDEEKSEEEEEKEEVE